jgi:hypothetical protein
MTPDYSGLGKLTSLEQAISQALMVPFKVVMSDEVGNGLQYCRTRHLVRAYWPVIFGNSSIGTESGPELAQSPVCASSTM